MQKAQICGKFCREFVGKVVHGLPWCSDGEESTCSEGDLGLIPSWEDPLEEGMATDSSILAWRVPLNRGTRWALIHGVAKSWTRLGN